MKNKILARLSDITHIHHRAAFTDVKKHVEPKQSAFMKLAVKRYSCRKFSPAPVSDEQIEQILEAVRIAPSAKNIQPVHVWVLKSEESREKLKIATKCTFDAPVVFMVGYNPAEAWVRKCDGTSRGEADSCIAGCHLMFEATDLGLGSVWVAAFDPQIIREQFPQTEGWVITALFPVGHPASDAVPFHLHNERKSLEEIVTTI